jgi:pimeloyl-ACP methyl ester carboxylesterase
MQTQTRYGKIHIRAHGGSGPVLLLLHGNSFDGRVFDQQFSLLTKNFRVVVVDLPGHGASDFASRPDEYALTGMAETVLEAMAELCHSFAVYGWSLGGHIAIEMARLSTSVKGVAVSGAPPLAPGLTSLISAFKPNLASRLAAKESWTEKQHAHFVTEALGPCLSPLPYLSDGRARPIIAQSLLKGVGRLQRAVVERGNTPVHLIATGHDPFVRSRYILNVKPALDPLRGTTFMERAGHAPFHDQPVEFARIITNFMHALGRETNVVNLAYRRKTTLWGAKR